MTTLLAACDLRFLVPIATALVCDTLIVYSQIYSDSRRESFIYVRDYFHRIELIGVIHPRTALDCR